MGEEQEQEWEMLKASFQKHLCLMSMVVKMKKTGLGKKGWRRIINA